jgi:sugar phosphate isomerase/epimerase
VSGNDREDAGRGATGASLSRREFVLSAGALVIPALAASPAVPASTASRLRPGIQLYSVRNILKEDFEATLARLAEFGFKEVEFAGLHNHSATEVRAILDRTGLKAPAGHMAYEAVRDQPEKAFAEARALGHRYVVVAWIDQSLRTPDGLRQVADVFNRAGEAARKAGLRFAYHNHDFEFTPMGEVLPYDLLLERTDPKLVFMELDLFWIRKGGHDAFEYFRRHPGRFRMVHIKDMAADGSMVDLGKGVIDWPPLLRAAKEAGVEHWFAEHDEPADPLAYARGAAAFLAGVRL